MGHRETDQNGSTAQIFCPLRSYGCTDSFHSSQRDEHHTSEVHMETLFCIIRAWRQAHEAALVDCAISPPFTDDIVPATHPSSNGYYQMIERLNSCMSESFASVPVANIPACAAAHSSPTVKSIDNRSRGSVRDTNGRSRDDQTQQLLQTEERLNNLRMNEIRSLIHPEHVPTVACQLVEARGQNPDLQAPTESIDTQLRENLCRMLQIQLNETPVSTDGLLIWSIDNISEKIAGAISKQRPYVDSPSFQTCMDGHRFWARLYLNGKADLRYLSFGVQLNFPVPVPFCGRITLILVDRSADRPLEHVIKSCQATGKDVGGWFGFDTFVDKNVLHSEPSRYIRDDSIYLLVRIDQTNVEKFASLDPNVRDALSQNDSV